MAPGPILAPAPASGLGTKTAGGGEKGKRKNLHVENTHPYGRHLKQQESAGWHKGSSRDGAGGGRGWGVCSGFQGAASVSPGWKMEGRMLGCFFPASFLPPNSPLWIPGWGRGAVKRPGGGGVVWFRGSAGRMKRRGPGAPFAQALRSVLRRSEPGRWPRCGKGFRVCTAGSGVGVPPALLPLFCLIFPAPS